MDDDEHDDGGRSARHPVRRAALGLVVGLLALWFAVAAVGGVADAADALGRVRPGWVGLAVLAGAARIGCYVAQVRAVGDRVGRLGWSESAEVAVLVYGVGAVLPASPAEGLAAAAWELRREGRTRRETGLVLGLSEWFTQRAFYGVAAVDLLLVVALDRLPWPGRTPVVVAAVVVLVVLVVSARLARRPGTAEVAAVWLGALRWRRPVPSVEARRRVGHEVHDAALAVLGSPRARWTPAVWSVAATLADAVTLGAACAGAGIEVDVTGVVLASVVATVATWVPLLPAGLGLVEASVPFVLHRMGAPAADALAATVVHRAAGTLLPALVGAVVALRLRSRRGAR